MEERLLMILNNVNYWLSFAEAKNAGLIIFNITLSIAVIGFILCNTLPVVFCIYFILLIIFNAMSIFFSMFSILPNTLKSSIIGNNDVDLHDFNNMNLIFYKDISKFKSHIHYIKTLYLYYENKDIQLNVINKIELDYAEEIFCNSKIVLRKYKLFNISLYCTLSSIFSPFIIFVLFYITRRTHG